MAGPDRALPLGLPGAVRGSSKRHSMPRVTAPQAGFYLLDIKCRPQPLPFVRVELEGDDDGPRGFFVPALPSTRYVLRVSGPAHLTVESTGIEHAGLRRISRLEARIRARRKKDRALTLSFGGKADLTPLISGAGPEGKELRKALKLIGNWGFSLTGDALQRTPGLLDEILPGRAPDAPPAAHRATPRTTPRPDGAPRFAMVLHLYYRDLWPEFERRLLSLDMPFHLIVTTTQEDAGFESAVRAAFPDAQIFVYENRGRDIGPFMQLLHDGHLDRFPLICKLHGKRSGVSGPRALFGTVWRRTNIADLIGTTDQVTSILARFEKNPKLAMIGSRRFRLPNAHIGDEGAWAENRETTLGLAADLGIAPTDFRLDFFAGTMFWARRETLDALRGLGLTLEDFPAETGAVDGELAHALERLFGALPYRDGMTVEDTSIMIE